MRAVRAGVLYVALVLALGFLLGVMRNLLLAPAVGETRAVLLELPVMLLASWVCCRFALSRLSVPAGDRLLMGGTFLGLLLAAEAALGLALGSTLQSIVREWQRVPGSLGLAAQLLSAAFPLLQRPR